MIPNVVQACQIKDLDVRCCNSYFQVMQHIFQAYAKNAFNQEGAKNANNLFLFLMLFGYSKSAILNFME